MSITNELDLERLVFGEYTTPDGPLLDDHFLVVIDSEMHINEIPIGSDECNKLVESLRKYLRSENIFSLCDKTDYQSRVIYPKALEGEDIFLFEESASQGSFIKKIFPKKSLLKIINPKIKDYIEAR